jgi:hypothetical protein
MPGARGPIKKNRQSISIQEQCKKKPHEQWHLKSKNLVNRGHSEMNPLPGLFRMTGLMQTQPERSQIQFHFIIEGLQVRDYH